MTWLSCLALLALAILMLVWHCRLRSAVKERASRPGDLAHARLEYVEKLFKTRRPFLLTARVDRGYRVDDGSVVLVELKTRRQDRVYASDLIQLSAQKLAVEQQTGQRVASYAFVTVERVDQPGGRRRSHRVTLLSKGDMVALQGRRNDVLVGRVAPTYAASLQACNVCAFRSRCDRLNR